MNIEFFCQDNNIIDYWPPKPAIECIPENIANLQEPKEKYNNTEKPILNIKACMPAMDYMSAGYILFNSYEIEFESSFHQFKEQLTLKTSQTIIQDSDNSNINGRKSLAVFEESECPISKEGKGKNYFKFKSSWGVRTPAGYSCLIIQPFYLKSKLFQIIPSIVDTDKYHLPIPVSGYLTTKDKIRIEPGTPLLQIIPFKRDEWNMKINNEFPSDKSKFFIWNAYYRLFHAIKKYV